MAGSFPAKKTAFLDQLVACLDANMNCASKAQNGLGTPMAGTNVIRVLHDETAIEHRRTAIAHRLGDPTL